MLPTMSLSLFFHELEGSEQGLTEVTAIAALACIPAQLSEPGIITVQWGLIRTLQYAFKFYPNS